MRSIILLLIGVILTATMEFIILYLLKVKDKRLWLSIPINVCTNLLLNGILSIIYHYSNLRLSIYALIICLLEVGIIFLEWLYYQLIHNDKKNFLYSLIANATSGILGSLIIGLISIFF